MLDLTTPPESLEPVETASRDELAALQLERLQDTLRHAYENVPHYRRSFDADGVHPEDCRSLEDLARFPFTTNQDLRAGYPFGMFAVPHAAATAAEELKQHIKATIGVTVEVAAMEPGSIERSMGKMRRIVDHRPR